MKILTQKFNTKVKMQVLRKGRKTSLTIKIGSLKDGQLAAVEPDAVAPQKDDSLNLVVQELNDRDRQALDISSGGVIVRDVSRGPAFDAGIRIGDVILELANKKITGFNSYKLITRNLKKGSVVPVLISRQKSPLYIALRIPVD